MSRILNEQEKDDDWKEKRPTSSQRRQGKRVSFPNIMGSITDSDDDDIHSEVVKDDSEIDSRSQTSRLLEYSSFFFPKFFLVELFSCQIRVHYNKLHDCSCIENSPLFWQHLKKKISVWWRESSCCLVSIKI